MCSSVDIDSISSPETISPSSPYSDTFDDVTITEEKFKPSSTNSSTATPAPLIFPVSLKDLNLHEIKAVKIIRNGSTIVSNAANNVLKGMKTASSGVPDAIKKLLCPVQVSVATPVSATVPPKTTQTSYQQTYPPIVLTGES